MARPSLADSLKASLSKGVHVDTAAKIARGFEPAPEDTVEVVELVKAVPLPDPPLVVAPSRIEPVTPTITPSDSSTLIQSDNITPYDSQTVRLSDSRTVIQSNPQTVIRSNSRTVEPSDTHTVRHPDSQTVKQATPQTVSQYQTSYQTPSGYVPLEVLNLSYNQACVLEFLIQNNSGVTNYRTISDITHVGMPSTREAVSRLIIKGFMLKPVTVKSAAFQGFSYVLNKVLCDHFLNAGGLSQSVYKEHQTVPQTVSQSDGMTVKLSDCRTVHSSSESLEDLKPTTTSNPQAVSPSDSLTVRPSNPQALRPSDSNTITPSDSSFVLTGAVGAYWHEEGASEGQAQKWCQDFEIDPGQMRQQLEWARFDLENNNRREEVKKDPVSWFFGHLRKTGGAFPRPVNYKSPAEFRAEVMEQELAREKEARARVSAAETEQRFQQLMADPESVQFQALYSLVNGFAKEQGGIALEIAMRELFKERVGG